MVIIEFFTKEACKNPDNTMEIPCVIYNPDDGQKRDLSPLIKLSGLYDIVNIKSENLANIFLSSFCFPHLLCIFSP
jgi:hypothetical protein